MAVGRSMPSTLETDRLHLRAWTDADAALLRELWAERDPSARLRIGPDGRPTVEELRLDLGRRRADTERTGLALLVIERRGTPGLVGYCGFIVGQASEDEPEIAYELLRRFHGRGYATEAALAVLDAADEAGRRRLWSTVRIWNAPSRRVVAKLGFVESGRVDRDPVRGDSLRYVRDAPESHPVAG